MIIKIILLLLFLTHHRRVIYSLGFCKYVQTTVMGKNSHPWFAKLKLRRSVHSSLERAGQNANKE